MKVARASARADRMVAPRSDCCDRGLPMRTLTLLLMLTTGAASALAAGKTKGSRRAPAARSAPASQPGTDTAAPRAPAPSADTSTAAEPAAAEPVRPAGKAPKAKVYTFSGLDVEGKLKTPQLLYFLNRVRLELDTTGRERRSFLKELEQSSDDKGL
jgi:hypothetical protein